MSDYEDRSYLSVAEAAAYLGINASAVHALVRCGKLRSCRAGSGQHRFDIRDVEKFVPLTRGKIDSRYVGDETILEVRDTRQVLYLGDSRRMDRVADASVHLAVTSPPYFNAKMYSQDEENDLGNIHNLSQWLEEIGKVWSEVFRVLQPGRKFFLNIMNLPVRNGGGFRTLNLMGRMVDICEDMGFVFKRDIIWQKTNGVRAHFGTYPYPGGILINNMHEFILEFDKPAKADVRKYAHVTETEREASKLDKDFWLSLKNSDIWLMKPEKSGNRRKHAAPFPLEIPRRLIKAYSFVGETVLDPFCGSGTTLAAAVDQGRHGIGYDLNSDFLGLAIDRIKEVQGRMFP